MNRRNDVKKPGPADRKRQRQKNGITMKRPLKKLGAYRSLFAMNRGFETVLLSCAELKKLGFLSHRHLKRFQALAEELRAGTNHRVTEAVRDFEERDWARFGRLIAQGKDHA